MNTIDDIILELTKLKEQVGGDCPIFTRDRYNNCSSLIFRVGKKAKNEIKEVTRKGVTAIIVSNYDANGNLIRG